VTDEKLFSAFAAKRAEIGAPLIADPSAMTPAEEFVADLARICLPVAEAGYLFGKDRSTMYRWASGKVPVPDLARRILKAEVAACRAHAYKLADGSYYWQGFRNGHPVGPEAESRAAAFRHTWSRT